jgi:hypothetical protein
VGAFGGLMEELVVPVGPRGSAGMNWGVSESSEEVHMVDA